MYNSLSYKTKQFFWLLIKLSIVIGCGYFIYTKLIENEQLNFSNFYENLIKNDVFSLKNVTFLLIFTIFNWFFEILKWQSLVNFIQKISFSEATKQSFASLTTSLITPNRIGEYGAKALFFEKLLRKQILGLNFIGNFYQLLATLFFGVIGFTYFVFKQQIQLDFNLILVVFFILIFLFVIIYFILRKFKIGALYLNKIKKFINTIPLKLNFKIGFLSFLRFLIFSHQFYFLLLIFKIDISYIDAISAITSIYLIASIVPMLSLFDVVLKGSVAIWVFSYFKIEPFTILSITTLMWILNFVFPAIIGSYFVLTFKPKFAK